MTSWPKKVPGHSSSSLSDVRFRIGISYGPESGPYPHYAAAVRAAADRLKLDVETVDLSERTIAKVSVDGIVFTGGGDVNPERFGKGHEADRVSGVDNDRDALEFGLLAEARKKDVPILGICRGLQLLNVAHGGTLITDIPTARDHVKTAAGNDARHDIALHEGSLVAEVAGGTRANVNSSHHQAVDRLAPPFCETARADDGTVEAFEWAQPGGKPFFLAVQWHPERMDQTEPLAGRLFERFLSAVATSVSQSVSRP